MTEVKTCSHDNLFYLLSLPPNMASCRVSCGKNTTSGQHYFFFLSCWTECKPDATVTHHCLFRCKVVLQDKTGLAGGSWLALWMLNTKIVPYTTDNTKLMGNLFYSSFMVWFQILKQQKFNKEKTFIKISFFPPPTRSAVCRFTTETDQSQRVTTS